jgi:hypothetical protein
MQENAPYQSFWFDSISLTRIGFWIIVFKSGLLIDLICSATLSDHCVLHPKKLQSRSICQKVFI